MEARVRAVRGATTLDKDSPEQVESRTQELVREMLSRNEIANEDLVSVFFSTTDDITAGFPAAAARQLGLEEVPLFGTREMSVPGALPRCVRVLIHCYSTRPRAEIQHVYLEGARVLRADLVD